MSKISTGHAKKLIKNYVDNKIGNTITVDETRAVWFSRDELLDALNTPVHGIMPNGLRFYFGAYESYSSGRPPKYSEDENKITLVIVATTGMIGITGSVIKHPYRNNPEEVLPFDLLETPDAVPEYDRAFIEVNDGQICPPPPVIVI